MKVMDAIKEAEALILAAKELLDSSKSQNVYLAQYDLDHAIKALAAKPNKATRLRVVTM